MLPLWAMATLGAAPSLVLNDGTRHPLVGYGTYKVGVVPASASSAATGAASPADAANPAECVEAAIGLGYRFIDCAEFYANEKAVGEGIARAGVPRGELYLASKVWTSTIHAGPEAVQAQLAQTLSDLGTSYLDLYCIHWPVPTKHVEAYKQLEKAHKAGLIRSIGVSNYAKEDYQELIDAGITVMPAINQIEINPFLYRKETIAFFESVGCKLQSYRALRDGKAFEDPTVVEIASKLGKTPAQVTWDSPRALLLPHKLPRGLPTWAAPTRSSGPFPQILGRWCVQHGIIAIVKSVKAERMAENLAIFDFEIPPEDMERLDNLTTPDAIAKFVELYRKCVVRDTPLSPELARMEITEM